jgi:hypothetical protein
MGRRIMIPVGLLAVLAGSSMLLALVWTPIWLVPFTVALKRTLIVGFILALMPLTYGTGPVRPEQRLSRLSKLYLRPLPWPALILTSPLLTFLLIALQIVLIERNPNLTLTQYLREEIWVLWLVMLPTAALWLAGHQLWIRGRAGDEGSSED